MPLAPQLSALKSRLVRKNNSFNPELDFMRAAAVLMVVVDHTALALHRNSVFGFSADRLGLFGVWIFFVHTTLVLMWSLERKPYALDFYVRRIFRIYPLALVAIFIATVTRAPLTGTLDNFFQFHRISIPNFLATSLLLYNLAPMQWGFHPIVNVVWTLPLEVDMYLFLPALFVFAGHVRARWPLVLLWLFACIAIKVSGASGGFSFVSAIPCFLPGVIAYVGYKKAMPSIPAWLFPPFLLALVAILLRHPSIPIGWVFSLMLGLTLPYFRPLTASLFTEVSHQIAKYSFGIYLAHPFGLALGCYLLHRRPLALQLTVELLTIVIASIAGYHFIEAPMVRIGSRLAARLQVRTLPGSTLSADQPTT
jgi:peptidoglycan/LPS O-acetylase OafA/YrhL